jgi:transcriptional regulator with XRE-family HTH domain
LKEKGLHIYINGSNLKKFRELENITQDDLGAELSVTRQTINIWEAKGTVKLDNRRLEKLAKILKVSTKDLIVKKPYDVPQGEIPFYDTIISEANILEDEGIAYASNVEMIDPGTWFKTANGALRVYGHSMFPKYPAGCIIAYKIADKGVIIWGEDYVIELKDRRIVKRLEISKVANCVKAVSYNKSEDYAYPPIEIPLKKIKGLFMVLGKVELEASL